MHLPLHCGAETSLEEFRIDGNGQFCWHATIKDIDGVPLAGGFGSSQLEARSVAYSEFLERREFKAIKSDADLHQYWGIDLVPTGCGFAVGRDLYSTIIRSVGEAVERWVRSKWIDEHYKMHRLNPAQVKMSLDPVALALCREFNDVSFFEKEVAISFSERFFRFKVGAVLAFEGAGVFLGAAVTPGHTKLWRHALVECYRSLLVSKNNTPTNSFPDNRVRFFGKNAEIGVAMIDRAVNDRWPTPRVLLHRSKMIEGGEYYLVRTLLDGWTSWHKGDEKRFLY